jgi:glycosyltransferase involved in cell wall biosynthesis
MDDYSPYIERDRMRLIYQSVTLPYTIIHEDKISPDKKFFQCAIIGSLDPWKGQDEAIAAMSELVRRGVNAHLLIVGDGSQHFREKLHKQIMQMGLEEHVKFAGYIRDPLQFMQDIDVILVCSHWEAFGRITVEAMLAGKAVIGSANGGTVELIKDGKTGLLYQHGNHLQLADKIQFLYENPETRLELGVAANQWAEGRYTQERYVKDLLELFEQVLMEHRHSSQEIF